MITEYAVLKKAMYSARIFKALLQGGTLTHFLHVNQLWNRGDTCRLGRDRSKKNNAAENHHR